MVGGHSVTSPLIWGDMDNILEALCHTQTRSIQNTDPIKIPNLPPTQQGEWTLLPLGLGAKAHNAASHL